MKKIGLGLIALGVIAFLAFTPERPSGELQIGESSPAMAKSVKDINGQETALRSLSKQNGLLVVFSCNTCPFVVAWEDRYNALHEMCEKNNVGMVLVNSNEAFRDKEDSMEAMKQHAKDLGYTMPYVVDRNHEIADAFGARTTPHVFLFDNKLELAYRGAIDDNYKDKDGVSATYLQDALTAMVAGEEIAPNTTKALGCSIKRMKK